MAVNPIGVGRFGTSRVGFCLVGHFPVLRGQWPEGVELIEVTLPVLVGFGNQFMTLPHIFPEKFEQRFSVRSEGASLMDETSI